MNPWCVHCQQGGEIVDLPKWEKLLWTKKDNSGSDLVEGAFVRMHSRGVWALACSCIGALSLLPLSWGADALIFLCCFNLPWFFACLWILGNLSNLFCFLISFSVLLLFLCFCSISGYRLVCWQCTHQGGDWEPMDQPHCSRMMSDC